MKVVYQKSVQTNQINVRNFDTYAEAPLSKQYVFLWRHSVLFGEDCRLHCPAKYVGIRTTFRDWDAPSGAGARMAGACSDQPERAHSRSVGRL